MEFSKLGQVFDAYSFVKKVPSGHPGRVDFVCKQVTFTIHWPNGEASHPLTKSLLRQPRNVPREAKAESCLPKGQAEFKLISSPVMAAKKTNVIDS